MKDGFRLLVDRLLYTDKGQIISSIVIGFAFALIFRKVCEGKECRLILAPPLEHIKSTIYELEGDCYRYIAYPVKCPREAFVIPSHPPEK